MKQMKWLIGILLICATAYGASIFVRDRGIFVTDLKVGEKSTISDDTAFEVVSTTKGSIPAPKMTQAQRDAISTPTAGMLIYNNDVNKVNQYNGSAWVEVAGSGAGGITYFSDFEADDTNQVSIYDDGASATPTDLTGGSPSTATVSSETTDFLSGDGGASYLLSKSAADGQGEGWSITSTTLFRLETLGQNRISVSFNYETSANYSDDDVTVWIYRVGSNTIEQCQGRSIFDNSFSNGLKKADDGGQYICEFTGSSTDTSFRLGLHIASVNASAYDITLDRIRGGPGVKLNGAVQTDWQEFTMTILASSNPSKATTPDVDEARWRRVGANMEIQYRYAQSAATGASAGTGTYQFQIPSGYTIDFNKVGIAGGSSVVPTVGSGHAFSSSNESSVGAVSIGTDNTSLVLHLANRTDPTASVSATFHDLAETVVQYNFFASVPITGWGPGEILSGTQADHERALAYYSTNAGQTIETAGAGEVVDFEDLNYDTHNAVTTGASWVFTAPRSGKYNFSTRIFFDDGQWNTGDNAILYIRENASNPIVIDYYESEATQTTQVSLGGSTDLELEEGVTADFFVDISRTSGDLALNASGNLNWMSVSEHTNLTTFALESQNIIKSNGPDWRFISSRASCAGSSGFTLNPDSFFASIGNVSGGACTLTTTDTISVWGGCSVSSDGETNPSLNFSTHTYATGSPGTFVVDCDNSSTGADCTSYSVVLQCMYKN